MTTTLLDERTIRDHPTPRPLSLSDNQLSHILDAAQPLQPDDRSAFLLDVAQALQGREIGDGLIARTCAEVQRKFLRPPDLSRGRGYSRWRR